MLLVGPKDVVKKDVLSSLPWESLAYSWRATVLVKFMRLVAITAVLAIEDYSRAGKQKLSHTGRHCAIQGCSHICA